jgi:HAD superfamily phosphatase (TIGR01681 family)
MSVDTKVSIEPKGFLDKVSIEPKGFLDNVSTPKYFSNELHSLNNIDLIVFDYDHTLIQHVENEKEDKKKLFDEEFYRWLFSKLLLKGKKMAIATLGGKERVVRHFNEVFGTEQKFFPRDTIISPATFGLEEGKFMDKTIQLNKLCEMFHISDKTKILFFDDLHKNIENVKAGGFVNSYLVDPRRGVTKNYFFRKMKTLKRKLMEQKIKRKQEDEIEQDKEDTKEEVTDKPKNKRRKHDSASPHFDFVEALKRERP